MEPSILMDSPEVRPEVFLPNLAKVHQQKSLKVDEVSPRWWMGGWSLNKGSEDV